MLTQFVLIIDWSSQLYNNLSSCEIKTWKSSGLNGIQTHDLCDTSAVLWSLCEFVIYPYWGEGSKGLYERSYNISELKQINYWLIIAVIHTTQLSSCEITVIAINNWFVSPQFKYMIFHIHFHSSPSTGILRAHSDHLPDGLITQLVEHCTGTAEVMGSNPIQARLFSGFIFTTA